MSATELLDRARRRVLRATVLICLLIAISNLVGAIAEFAPGGTVRGPAIALATAWCALWLAAALFTTATLRCFSSWRATSAVLATACAVTVALTGGIVSPLVAVSANAGWIASVVVRARDALVMSLAICCAIFAGYFMAGDSPRDIFAGPHRYFAVANALLPILSGIAGALLATVTNEIFSGLGRRLSHLRAGAPASTPALTSLLAGQAVGALLPPARGRERPVSLRLTQAEQAVVELLADGHRPKQIARLRGVALSTVRSQISAAKAKSGARTINDLIVLAWDLDPPAR